MLDRRRFLAAGAAASALSLLGPACRAAARPAGSAGPVVPAVAAGAAPALAPRAAASAGAGPFRLAYAPHLGMFRHLAGDDPLDQLRFMADQGFTAFEDNELAGRPVELQEAIGKELARLGMRMGVFVAHGNAWGKPSFASGDAAERERFLADLRSSVDVARRVGATWMTVVPGERHPRLDDGYQAAHVVDTLRFGADVLAPEGLVMVLEPLNPQRDHPRMFLSTVSQAYLLCRAVDSPACKILYDVYHQQIAGGNLLPNLDLAWSELGYVQVGDTPGRNEPGTGEIDYAAVFRHLAAKGYTGIVGMEHGVAGEGADGEHAVIAAYRARDPA